MLKRDSLTRKPQNILERPELIYNHFPDSIDNLHAQNSIQTISTKINKTLTIEITAAEQDFHAWNLFFFSHESGRAGLRGEKRDWRETRVRCAKEEIKRFLTVIVNSALCYVRVCEIEKTNTRRDMRERSAANWHFNLLLFVLEQSQHENKRVSVKFELWTR